MAELQEFVDKAWLGERGTEEMERGVTEWLFEAEKIIECFRETRMLFITSSVSLSSLTKIHIMNLPLIVIFI